MHHEKTFFNRLNVEEQSIAGSLHAGPFWIHLRLLSVHLIVADEQLEGLAQDCMRMTDGTSL